MEMVMLFSEYLQSGLSMVQGWCSPEKAKRLYEILLQPECRSSVEIGVFGGSSLFPQAMAFRDKKNGLAIGIDPWTNASCLEDMENPANKNWWGNLDLENVYLDFMNKVKSFGVHNNLKVYRKKSSEIHHKIELESVDLLHIDGNHCERLAYEDSVNYLPKVRRGGYIFFDDIMWTESGDKLSTRKGLDFLLKSCDEVELVGNDCMILRKR